MATGVPPNELLRHLPEANQFLSERVSVVNAAHAKEASLSQRVTLTHPETAPLVPKSYRGAAS